jgi:hypothetical protein
LDVSESGLPNVRWAPEWLAARESLLSLPERALRHSSEEAE